MQREMQLLFSSLTLRKYPFEKSRGDRLLGILIKAHERYHLLRAVVGFVIDAMTVHKVQRRCHVDKLNAVASQPHKMLKLFFKRQGGISVGAVKSDESPNLHFVVGVDLPLFSLRFVIRFY